MLDFVDAFDQSEAEGINLIKNNFERELVLINNEIVGEVGSDKINYYFIIGIGEYRQKLSDMGVKIINNLFLASGQFKKSYFVFIDNYSSYKKLQLEPWYYQSVNNTCGIWLGADIGSQVIINVTNLSLDDKKLEFDYMGFAINNGKHEIIKYVVAGDENEK